MAEQSALKGIIYERISILLSLAEEAMRKGNEARAKRYVFLARKLSTRYNCRLSKKDKMRFCKKCSLPRIPGLNVKIRLRKRTRTVEYECDCGGKAGFKY